MRPGMAGVTCLFAIPFLLLFATVVARLIDNERRSAGTHDVEWNGRDQSGRAATSGIYVYRLTAGKETISRNMVLLR